MRYISLVVFSNRMKHNMACTVLNSEKYILYKALYYPAIFITNIRLHNVFKDKERTIHYLNRVIIVLSKKRRDVIEEIFGCL